jgi:hypothetical protein
MGGREEDRRREEKRTVTYGWKEFGGRVSMSAEMFLIFLHEKFIFSQQGQTNFSIHIVDCSFSFLSKVRAINISQCLDD